MITADICTDLDVLANDARAVEDFPGTPLDDKIRLAVNDWLTPRLLQHGYQPEKHRTRRVPSSCFARTGGAWVDKTADASGVESELNLAAILASPANDALYLGLDRPFMGLFASMTDTVNGQAISASITYWNGQWTTLGSSLTNQTAVSGTPFARAGRINWPEPSDWLLREVNDSGPLYWVRIQVDATPGPCLIDQLLPITRSRLSQAVALRTLGYVYTEASGGSGRGDWKAKAEAMEKAADAHLQVVLPYIVDEFDIDVSGAVETTEVNSVAAIAAPWTWERG